VVVKLFYVNIFLTHCEICLFKVLLLSVYDFLFKVVTNHIIHHLPEGIKDLDLYMGHGCLHMSALIHGFAEEQ